MLVPEESLRVKEILHKNLSEYNFTNFKIIEEDSLIAFDLVENNYFDFIFIDADHRYEYIAKDIANYWPKLRISGLMCGHDYDWAHSGVVRAVNEAFTEKSIYGGIWKTQKL